MTPDLPNPGDAAAPPVPDHWPELPLFPLQTVLFPGGLLPLKVFEARYLDLISHCLRNRSPFGVACIGQGSEVRGGGDKVRLEPIAVLAHLQDVDAEQPGILKVRCIGGPSGCRAARRPHPANGPAERKSTRLNSSHRR